jgi:uncharacterized membrane protein
MIAPNKSPAPVASGAIASQPVQSSAWLARGAAAGLLALIVLCVAWELWLAPVRPGGSWLVLKVLPLLFPLIGVLKHKLYTLQWSAMLMMLYFTEGVVRIGDKAPVPTMAALEIVLSVTFFACAVAYVRPYKREAKRVAKLAALQLAHPAPEKAQP